MNPIIFGAGEQSFTSNGLGRVSEAVLCTVTEELNGIFEAELQVPITDPFYQEIKLQRIIYCKTANGKQPFEIYKISKPLDGVVTVYLQHLSYRLAKMTALPLTATSCQDAIEKLIAYADDGAEWAVWTDKDIEKAWTLKNPRSIRNCLGGEQGSVLQLFGGEYEWDHRTVKLHTHRGADNHVWIRYGKNLTDLTDEDDETTIYTSVLPFVIVQASEEGEEDTLILGDKIETGMEYSDPAYNMTVPLDLSNEFQVEPAEEGEEPVLPTKEEINARAETYMVANTPWLSKKTLTVSFAPLWETEEYKDVAPLEEVRLGDTVHVSYSALGVSQAMKVIRIVYDALRERVVEVELGDKRASLGNLINDTAQAAAEAAVTSINGKLVAVEAQFGRVTALEAYVGDLQANNIDADYIKANRADIVTLTADTAEIRQLVAAQATISEALIGRVSANEGNIQDLQAGKADVGDLNAAVANITSLDGAVANIKTILAGNVGTGDLQTINLNSANTQLDVALIRTLLANNITVNDLKAGAIDTSRFTIGEDNVIINNRTIQILDENDVVRVQIGLDANDDFTFTLFDETGQGILIDADGLHPGAVPDGLIVDQMVADDANIAGSKLDIDSVITEINENGTETISSTRVWYDEENRSLNAVFADMQTDIDDLETTTASQTTAIEATQGKLSALITDDELSRLNTRAGLAVSQGVVVVGGDTLILGSSAVQRMENNYAVATMEIDGLRASMGAMETEIDGNIETVRSQVAEYKATLDEFSTYVGETYRTQEQVEDQIDGRLVNYVTTTEMNSAIEQTTQSITSTVTSLVEETAADAVDAELAKTIGVFGALRTINDDGTVTYTAQVLRGDQDVAQSYPAYCYEWFKIAGSENTETSLGYGYSITVDPEDFQWGGTVVGVFSAYEEKTLAVSAGTLAVSQGTLQLNIA